MRISRFISTVCISAVAALLAGCHGDTIGATTPAVAAPSSALPYHRTYHYTGTKQVFNVPGRVTQISVVARGAAGAAGTDKYRVADARGGRVVAVIPVTPGEQLAIFVGGSGEHDGFNGGAPGGRHGRCNCSKGFTGGGASDVREGGDTTDNRILVAGGGGGAGGADPIYYSLQGAGGAGGGLDGDAGLGGGSGSELAGGGGAGGTQLAGGAGGRGGDFYGQSGGNGRHGIIGQGGLGGSGHTRNDQGGAGGGGGGGGYFGGGGGGAGGGYYLSYCYACQGGGGGGGSSYIETSATKARTWANWKDATGDGLIVLSWAK